MATLAELKAQSPRYQSLSDEQFADLVYQKHYAGKLPRAEFDVRVGMGQPDYMGKGFMPESFQRFTDRAMDPFGIKDEVMGGLQFARKFVTSGGDIDEASKAYTAAAERDRAEQSVARQDYGIVPELLGGIGAAGLVKGAVRAGLPLATRIKNAAKTGAAFGAGAGAGHSEGGITERAIGAGYGAGAGALVGPLAQEVVAPIAARTVAGIQRGARSAGEKIRDTFGDVIPPLRRSADDRFVRALQRGNMTVDDAAAEYERQVALGRYGKKTDIGVPVTPADLSPSMQRQARALKIAPGRASTMAEEIYGARQAGQFDRAIDYLRRGLKVTKADYTKTLKALEKEMKEASAPAYKAFYDLKGVRGLPQRYDIGPVLRKSEARDANLAPNLKRMMRQARAQFMDENVIRRMDRDFNREVFLGKDAILGRSPTYQLTGQRFDSGKQALDDMIEQAKARGQANQVRLLTELKNDLLRVIDQQSMRQAVKVTSHDAFDATGKKVKSRFETPQVDDKGKPIYESLYAKARDAYASPAQIRDALTTGRTFAKGDSEVTAEAYKAMTTAQKRAFRIGMARQLRKELGRKEIGQNFIGYFRRPNTQEILQDVMSPAEYKRFMDLIDVEKNFAQSNQVIRGGSPTADKLADQEDLNAFLTMGRVIKDKGLAGAAFDAIGTGIERALRMREVDAHNLARLMFETDQGKVRANFARLKLLYGPKKVQEAMEIARRGALAFMGGTAMEAGRRVAISPMDLDLQPLP